MWRDLLRRAGPPLVCIAASLGVSGGTSAADDAPPPGADQAQRAEGFVPPQIILESQKHPVYPPAAMAARYTGSVMVELTVLRNGSVGQPKVTHCTHPNVGFEAAALEAVKQWRFVPATEGAEPVEVNTRIQLNFTRTGQPDGMFVVAVGRQGWKKSGDSEPQQGSSPTPSGPGK